MILDFILVVLLTSLRNKQVLEYPFWELQEESIASCQCLEVSIWWTCIRRVLVWMRTVIVMILFLPTNMETS
jgi:hypothetical protein